MSPDPEKRKYAILFIDDEEQSQKYFSQIFGAGYRVLLASDGDQGLELFKKHQHEIGVVVSDQRMPGISGSELLAEVAGSNPDIVNILSTAYSDLDAAIDAVNDGGIYRYVTKPWDLVELDVTLRRAMDYFELKAQVRRLSATKILGLEQMFYQSRLLASIAIPALTLGGPSTVHAFRDLLRLSLVDEVEVQQSSAGILSDLIDTDQRNARMESFRTSLETLMKFATEAQPIQADALKEQVNALLIGTTTDGSRPLITEALFLLLRDEADEEALQKLASVIAAYHQGLVISHGSSGWEVQEAPLDENATTIGELCSLFVDDTFLIGSVLQEIRR